MIRHITEEIEPVRRRPEERVYQNSGGIGPKMTTGEPTAQKLKGGPQVKSEGGERGKKERRNQPPTRVQRQHLLDEVIRLKSVVTKALQISKVVVALDNIRLSHKFTILIVRMAAASENVVKHTAQREDIDCSSSSSIRLRIHHRRLGRFGILRVGYEHRIWILIIHQQFWSTPTRCACRMSRCGSEGALVVLQLLTEPKVRDQQAEGRMAGPAAG